ncbi:hypothetical protein [Actinomadura rupiterrae]|uniref:hypothetical protein n=1 Tax=Actinomadura rupiterrae TaxID=559627 RepID=UPI0020A3C48F|nr:hypothetical protein [Actinomadura rupiterrae]MCP2337933.1 hypothetical protein [Actinomadura rupiterrae]
MATFGELLAVADLHRAKVQEALQQADIAVQASHPSSVAELGRLNRVLIRYTDRIASGFGLPGHHGARAEGIARRAGLLLRRADESLEMAQSTTRPDTYLAERLRSSSLALGCGLDLLATHLSPAEQGRIPTSVAAVITAPDSTRSLFRLICNHAVTAGQVALNAGPAASLAGHNILQAAAMTGSVSHVSEMGINAVPLNDTAQRLPPTEGESRDELLSGIDRSVRRLDASQAAGSVTTWRYLARAATIVCDLDRHLLCMLHLRAEAIGVSEIVEPLWETILALRPLGERWRTIARTWHDLTTAHADPETGPAMDASDLLIRLGRWAYDDPKWRPGHRSRSDSTDPAILAPTRQDLATVGLTVIKTLDACNQIAANHRDAVNDVFRARRLEGALSPLARRPHMLRGLLMRYPANYSAGRAAVAQLVDVLHKLSPEPQPRTTLALRVAALPSPAALASTDCPRTPTGWIADAPGHSTTPRHPGRATPPNPHR